MRRLTWVGGAVLAAVVIFMVVTAGRTAELPFDSAGWKAASTGHWARDNVRYRMRRGAARAVANCRSEEDVEAILGEPQGFADSMVTHVDTDPGAGLLYDLGAEAQPLLFWRERGEVWLAVELDQKARLLEVRISVQDKP
jgi:hypothetical protein